MELVDIYNDKHELQNYTKERDKLIDKEYRLSCYIWIINDKDQILIQQRLATAKICPNMWETASGAAKTGETALLAITRELEEEIGIKANKKDIKYIGSYVRVNDFVEVFLLKRKEPEGLSRSSSGVIPAKAGIFSCYDEDPASPARNG